MRCGLEAEEQTGGGGLGEVIEIKILVKKPGFEDSRNIFVKDPEVIGNVDLKFKEIQVQKKMSFEQGKDIMKSHLYEMLESTRDGLKGAGAEVMRRSLYLNLQYFYTE